MMKSNAKSIYETNFLTLQIKDCVKQMASICHDICCCCELMKYKFMLLYCTDLGENALLNMYTNSQKWSPNYCCERGERMSSLFDINQFFDHLNLLIIIILNTFYR